MTFKNFRKSLDLIKKAQEENDKLKEITQHLFTNLNWTGLDKREMDMIDILEMAMDDDGEHISYFIYEIEWGKKGKNCIEFEGKKYSLRTYKELYNYLYEN